MVQKAVVASKILGLGTVGLVGYDAHKRGKSCSESLKDSNHAKVMASLRLNKVRNRPSSTLGQIAQDTYIDQRSKTDIFKTKDAVTGYFSGLVQQVRTSIIPLALGVTALAGRGVLSKAGGIGLALYGLNYAFHNILTFEKKEEYVI